MSGIIIHRSHHAQQYVVVPNAVARDSRLTFRARGLLVMLLSLPPEWHVTADMLAEDNPDSRTAIRAAMAELRTVGYVELRKNRGADGRTRSQIEVFDTDHRTRRALPASGATSGNSASSQVAPDAGIPAAGGAAAKKKYGTSAARANARGGEVNPTPSPPAFGDLCGHCGGHGHTRQECPN